MNCVEFRRALGIDPHAIGVDFTRHRADCERCAEAHDHALRFERTLTRTLQIPAPMQLTDSILLAQATIDRRRRALQRRGALFALAASLALGVGIFTLRVEAKPLNTEAVEHLHAEAATLTMTRVVPAAEVTNAFEQRGLTLHNVPDGISFVACCPMDAHRTVHLVMPDGDDPVTIIYVVDKHIASRQDFQRDGLVGRSVPLGAGTLILLARKPLAFDRMEAIWRSALG